MSKRWHLTGRILIDNITQGRDRFHWAATPLKPYKVGNICYMTYRYSVLYFFNLSLKHFSPHRKRQFLWKYPNPETVIVPCFNVSSQSKIETLYIVSASVCSIKGRHIQTFNIFKQKAHVSHRSPEKPVYIYMYRHIWEERQGEGKTISPFWELIGPYL